jgi:Trypsin
MFLSSTLIDIREPEQSSFLSFTYFRRLAAMEENAEKRPGPDAGRQLRRPESTVSVEAAQIAGAREPDQLKGAIAAARAYADSVAGEDKVKFIHAFQIALELAVSAAAAEAAEVNTLAKVIERGIQLLPEQFYSDPTFVQNAVNMIKKEPFILGGSAATDFPDCVAVGASPPDNVEVYPFDLCCSGTLIAPNAVLTARHCAGGCGWRVLVGTDISDPHSKPIEVIEPRVIYPKYHDENDNDLAILILKDNVKPEIATPRQRATGAMIDAAQTVVVAGFGSTKAGTIVGGVGHRLMAEMPIKSHDCTSDAPGTFKCYEGLELVAIGLDKDSCKMDSGGPAYVKSGGQYYLAGVTSRQASGSTRCGDGSVYVRVDKYEEWINQVLQEHSPVE